MQLIGPKFFEYYKRGLPDLESTSFLCSFYFSIFSSFYYFSFIPDFLLIWENTLDRLDYGARLTLPLLLDKQFTLLSSISSLQVTVSSLKTLNSAENLLYCSISPPSDEILIKFSSIVDEPIRLPLIKFDKTLL